MPNTKIQVQSGTITEFNPETGLGVVLFSEDQDAVEFRSVDFRSGRPTRFPRDGEVVEVVLAQGVMVSVRSVLD